MKQLPQQNAGSGFNSGTALDRFHRLECKHKNKNEKNLNNP
jgi:hypothetical protein